MKYLLVSLIAVGLIGGSQVATAKKHAGPTQIPTQKLITLAQVDKVNVQVDIQNETGGNKLQPVPD